MILLKSAIFALIAALLAQLAAAVGGKFSALLHRRIGSGQIFAPSAKLLAKSASDTRGTLALSLFAACAFGGICLLPFAPEFSLFGEPSRALIAPSSLAVALYLALLACSLCGALAWAFGRDLPRFGTRVAAVCASAIVPALFAVLPAAISVGSLGLTDIVNYQRGGIGGWLVWRHPVSFTIFWVCAFILCDAKPLSSTFGVPHSASGTQLALWQLGRSINLLTCSCLIALLFFGGYNRVWFVPGGLMMALKALFFYICFVVAGAALPNWRVDAIMRLCWTRMMPVLFICIAVSAAVLR